MNKKRPKVESFSSYKRKINSSGTPNKKKRIQSDFNVNNPTNNSYIAQKQKNLNAKHNRRVDEGLEKIRKTNSNTVKNQKKVINRAVGKSKKISAQKQKKSNSPQKRKVNPNRPRRTPEQINEDRRRAKKIKKIRNRIIRIIILLTSIVYSILWFWTKPAKLLKEKYQDDFVIEKITGINIFQTDKTKWNKEDWKSFFYIYCNFIGKQKYDDYNKFKGTVYFQENKVSDYYVEILLEKNVNDILNRNINKLANESLIYGEAEYDYCLKPEESIIQNFAADKKHRYNINIYYVEKTVIPNSIYKKINEDLFKGIECLSGNINLYIVNEKILYNMKSHHLYRHDLCNDCYTLLMTCPQVPFEYENGKISLSRLEFTKTLIKSFTKNRNVKSNVPIVIK